MKKTRLLFLGIFFLVFLCACSFGKAGQYTVTKDGMDFIINRDDSTISDGIHTYHYAFSGTSPEYSITITYPDGSRYQFHRSGNSGVGGGSDDYGKEKYTDGYVLCELLSGEAPSGAANIGLFLLALAIGILYAAFPRTAWKLQIGWLLKNGEPSSFALGLSRFCGVLLIVLAIVIMF